MAQREYTSKNPHQTKYTNDCKICVYEAQLHLTYDLFEIGS